jgi:hypothetical protein
LGAIAQLGEGYYVIVLVRVTIQFATTIFDARAHWGGAFGFLGWKEVTVAALV